MPESGCRYACSCHDVSKVCSSTTSACANAASTSPLRMRTLPSTLSFRCSCTSGASGCIAANASQTTGRSSYRTSTSFARGLRRLRRARGNQRDAIAHVAHLRVAKNGLILIDQSVAIARDVGGGQNRNHAGVAQSSRCIDGNNARMRAMRENRFESEHVIAYKIGRVAGRPGNLIAGIRARRRCSDKRHGNATSTARSCAAECMASRILR